MSQTTERPRDDQRQQDDQRQRERRQPSQADKAAMDKMAAEQKEAAGAASIGAQIILDYNSDAGKGARGGIGTMAENIAARDADLVAAGLDPVAPSGPPLGSAEALRKKQEAMAAPRYLPPTSSNATRMSSLAAGVSGENVKPPEPPIEPEPPLPGKPVEPPLGEQGQMWVMHDIGPNEFRREAEQDWTTDRAAATEYTDEQKNQTQVPQDRPSAAFKPADSV